MNKRGHPRAFRRAFGPSICAVVLTLWACICHGAEPSLERVIARARAAELWTEEAWLKLLHHRAGMFGGVASDVENGGFFFARDGESDPKAELEATLRAFYRPVSKSPDDHARCRFPARFHWLDRALGFASELPAIRCPKLERFEAGMTLESAALVYAANSVDRPVAAFGHTFLLLRRNGEPPGTQAVVEFTAETDTHNPVVYAFKGIVGLFPGRIKYLKLSDKLKEYLEDQERDLWEYELTLTRSELRQLTRHLWELSSASFDYTYASQNCSYGLLALLEAAAPRLDLLVHTKIAVLPADTIKALYETPGLVREVRYRPTRPDARQPGQKAPHLGHGSMRVLLGGGYTSQYDDGFYTLGYRMALHDFADPADGQPELSQIQFMDVRVRYEPLRHRLTLNEVTFAELTTLHSVLYAPTPSWRARFFGSRLHDTGCENQDCFAHGPNGSIGYSLVSRDERVAAFAMADAYVVFSGQLDGIGGSFVRAGVGPYAGIRVHAPDPLVAMLAGSWSYLPGQNLTHTYELRGALRLALAADVALGVEGLVQPSAIEGQFLSYIFF